jgi:adenylylsulfate kinase-like enzyme
MEEPVAGYNNTTNNTTNNIYKSQEAPRDDERYIFWLCGWAGTGKSTIARTVAREYASKGGQEQVSSLEAKGMSTTLACLSPVLPYS